MISTDALGNEIVCPICMKSIDVQGEGVVSRAPYKYVHVKCEQNDAFATLAKLSWYGDYKGEYN